MGSQRVGAPIYVEVRAGAPMERVWELTQDAGAHARWDLRFSRIEPTDAAAGGAEAGGAAAGGASAGASPGEGRAGGAGAEGAGRFRYERRMPGHTIRGTGISIGERHAADGSRTSALRFTTADRLSPLADGRGYWRYEPVEGGVLFLTGYDYRPGWGRFADRVLLRRLIGWMTAWSFDRLRIWAETGTPPEAWPLHSVLWFWRPERPRAARCARRPRRARRTEALATLATLEAP